MLENNWYSRFKTRINNRYLKKPKGFDEQWDEKSKASRAVLSLVSGKAIAEKSASTKEKYRFYKGLFGDLFEGIKSFASDAYETLEILLGQKKVTKPTKDIKLDKTIIVASPENNSKLLNKLIFALVLFSGIYIYSLYLQYQVSHHINILTPWFLIICVLCLMVFVIKRENKLIGVKNDMYIAQIRLKRNHFIYVFLWYVILILYGAYQLNSYKQNGVPNIVSSFTLFFASYSFYVYRFHRAFLKMNHALTVFIENDNAK